jgi:co-chaperonin GroES (HSP10)
MKLLKNYCLVAEIEKEQKTAGGIILSADAQLDKAHQPGLLIAKGPDVDAHLTVGDRVYLQWSESMPITHEGQAGVIISDEFIKAVIK